MLRWTVSLGLVVWLGCGEGTLDVVESSAAGGAGESGSGGAAGGSSSAGSGAGGAPSDGRWSAPAHALLEVVDQRGELVSSVLANSGYAATYAHTLAVAAGDVLRIHAQTEVTNDHPDPVNGRLRVLVNGEPAGPESTQNVMSYGSHHMPLRTDALWVAPAAGDAEVVVEYAASRGDASPVVLVEAGYGGLVIEHHRAFDSDGAAAAAGALGLADVTTTTTEAASTFGGSWAAHALAYQADVDVLAGDVLLVFGQSTSGYAGAIEMHGHGLFADGLRIAPWSTENTPWAVNQVPLASAAVHAPSAPGRVALAVSMHGVAGAGGAIVAGGGHLVAASLRAFEPGLQVLRSFALATDAPTAVTANAGAIVVSQVALDLRAGDRVRAAALAQLAYPAGFALGIFCTEHTELVDSAGAAVARSSRASKYITSDMEVMPLRTFAYLSAPSDGAHVVRTSLECLREGASPVVGIAHAATIAEVFGAP